jgi:N-acetylmuramoyl-L-alanine amidase
MAYHTEKPHHLLLLTAVLLLLLSLPVFASAAVILLDPGHGGKDAGIRISGSLSEAAFTLEIAKDVQARLKGGKNVKVVLTRSGDDDLSLAARLQTVDREKPDLFISLHVNAGFERKASGFEVYYLGFDGSTEASADGGAIARDMVKNKVLNESNRFGRIVLKHLDPLFPRGNRNLRDAPMVVFQNPSTPAVLIELGFATNQEDRKRLLDQESPKAIADAIASAIEEFVAAPGGKP